MVLQACVSQISDNSLNDLTPVICGFYCSTVCTPTITQRKDNHLLWERVLSVAADLGRADSVARFAAFSASTCCTYFSSGGSCEGCCRVMCGRCRRTISVKGLGLYAFWGCSGMGSGRALFTHNLQVQFVHEPFPRNIQEMRSPW